MQGKWLYGLALSLLLPAGAAMAGETQRAGVEEPQQARIHFVNHGAIRDWHPDGTRGLWVQDSHRQWYYAKLMTRCHGLNFADGVGFMTGPAGSFDRFSSVVAEGQWCPVSSLVKSEAPPPKA